MLQIRLSKPSNQTSGSAKHASVDTVTVACPDHLVLADLPVANGLGTSSPNAVIKNIGRRSRRQLGERVHFCVQCDFPIAIYGRLIPCEHAFCLDCARGDSLCYMCDERIQKIQTVKLMEEIYICAAPHCLKSFLKKSEFLLHVNQTHADLLHPDHKVKEGNESEAAVSAIRKYLAPDSTMQAPPPRPVSISPNTSSIQLNDRDQSRDPPPSRPVMNSRPVSSFPGLVPNPGAPPHASSDGTQQQFFACPYEIARKDSTPELKRSLPLGFPINFSQNYHPRPAWNIMSLGSVPLEPPMVSSSSEGTTTNHGFIRIMDPPGRVPFFQAGEYVQNNMGVSTPPPLDSTGMRQNMDGGDFTDPRTSKGVLAPQGLTLPPPPPPPPIPPPAHLSQLKRGGSFSGDENLDGPPPGFGWQPERHG